VDSNEQKSNIFYKFFAAAVKSRTNVRGNIKRISLFMIFARERTQGVWRILPPPKYAKHEEAEAYSRITTKAAGLGGRQESLSPSEGERCQHHSRSPAKATVQRATAGRCIQSSNQRILYIVKPV